MSNENQARKRSGGRLVKKARQSSNSRPFSAR